MGKLKKFIDWFFNTWNPNDKDYLEIIKGHQEFGEFLRRLEDKTKKEWYPFINFVVGLFVLSVSLSLVEKSYTRKEVNFEDLLLIFASTFLISILIILSSKSFPEEIKLARSINKKTKRLNALNPIVKCFINNKKENNTLTQEEKILIEAILCLDKSLLQSIKSLTETSIFNISIISFLLLFIGIESRDFLKENLLCKLQEFDVHFFNKKVSELEASSVFYVLHSLLLVIIYFFLRIDIFLKILVSITLVILILLIAIYTLSIIFLAFIFIILKFKFLFIFFLMAIFLFTLPILYIVFAIFEYKIRSKYLEKDLEKFRSIIPIKSDKSY